MIKEQKQDYYQTDQIFEASFRCLILLQYDRTTYQSDNDAHNLV